MIMRGTPKTLSQAIRNGLAESQERIEAHALDFISQKLTKAFIDMEMRDELEPEKPGYPILLDLAKALGVTVGTIELGVKGLGKSKGDNK